VVLGYAEYGAGASSIADRRVAGADAEVRRGDRHRQRRLPEVVLIDELGALVCGTTRAITAGAAAMWPAPRQTVDNSSSWERSVTITKSRCCRLDADGARQPASAMRFRSLSAIGSGR
jgi:hypothetical protein